MLHSKKENRAILSINMNQVDFCHQGMKILKTGLVYTSVSQTGDLDPGGGGRSRSRNKNRKLFSRDRRWFLSLVFNATLDEKPFSHKQHVAKGINILKASMIKFSYSLWHERQNLTKSYNVNCSCNVLSADNVWWIDCGSQLVSSLSSHTGCKGYKCHYFNWWLFIS